MSVTLKMQKIILSSMCKGQIQGKGLMLGAHQGVWLHPTYMQLYITKWTQIKLPLVYTLRRLHFN